MHTKGPWTYRPNPIEGSLEYRYSHWVDGIDDLGRTGKPVTDVRGYYDGESESNARLISSAPELLEACKRVLRAIEWSKTEDRLSTAEQADILSAAISKAEGGDKP